MTVLTSVPTSSLLSSEALNKIIQDETDRLSRKQQGIDAAYNSQQRNILLNQSYSMRMRSWSYILTVIALAIVICIMLMFMKEYLPSTIIDIFIIIVFAGAVIWAYLIYIDIQKRDENDYNLLSMRSTNLIDPNMISTNTKIDPNAPDSDSSTNISDMIYGNTCVGQSCCPSGYYYDANRNICMPITSIAGNLISM